jgi:hypothetical protein
MAQWEYRVVMLGEAAGYVDEGKYQDMLNKFGEDGWDCYSVAITAPKRLPTITFEPVAVAFLKRAVT